MRWDNLTVENTTEQASLPGHRDPATVRRFDVPEAMDMRFYEIRAKSGLNRVPKTSQMPFRWTINPFRGCSHSCTYCVGPETPILLADGRTKRMCDIKVGERIIGTHRLGRYRRYAETEVLDHWMTWKPGYRVHLADGTSLLTSGDHRFLTGRGWKHVTDAPGQRPHLTLNDTLLGTGKFADQPKHDADYQRGYLCGMIRGDGTLGSDRYEHPHRTMEIHQFRVALKDLDALERTRHFLEMAGVPTNEFAFGEAARQPQHAPIRAVGTARRAGVESVPSIIRWPLRPTLQWRKGFLAGIFDAEGSSGGWEPVRIASKDRTIIHWVSECCARLGFDFVIEGPNSIGCRNVRLRGGLRERLRFFHLVDPAITRKRIVQGIALKSDADLRVMEIEPMGMELPLFDMTTGTSDFIADGVVSHNCFARPTHQYLDFDAGRDFEREIIVKVNVPEVVRAELNRPSWKGEHVALGTNTDPYQWVESKYGLMRGIWEAMRDAHNPCSLLTRSPLVLRDLDLLSELVEVTDFHANLSVPTLDERAWRATEPRSPHPRKRIEAIAELNAHGIPCGALVAPLMPGINDDPAQIERLLEALIDAKVTGVGTNALYLRGEVRALWFDFLRDQRPDLLAHYEELYADGAYMPSAERARLANLVRQQGAPPNRDFRLRRPERRPTRERGGENRACVQGSLF